MQTYTLHPRDILFFRDARPMGGSAEGAGATWPLPSVLHSSLLSAFHDQWPDGVEEESRHQNFTAREKRKFDNGLTSSLRFGGLRTVGPFPVSDQEMFVPTPADLVPGGVMRPVRTIGNSNLPTPLRYSVASLQPPSKKRTGAWVSICELRKYLAGEADIQTCPSENLYCGEPRPGVGIDPATHANKESLFYQAVYLRLKKNVNMAFMAEAEARKFGKAEGVSLLDKLFLDQCRVNTIFGGQRGVAAIESCAESPLQIPLPEIAGNRVKWVLLTPALFDAGWRPDWVDPTGTVKLKSMPKRADFANRKAWREAAKSAPDIGATLVAARIPKNMPVSGWKLDMETDHAGGIPKPTRLLVPAGAVYYFDCDSADSAQALVTELHGKVKSQRLGEKGYGYGVCAAWELAKL